MKYVLIIGDGVADFPVDALNGKTPLEVARIPNINAIAKAGKSGRFRSIPKTLKPGSDVAAMSILGYDPAGMPGRGALEAASLGIELSESQVAFRCNLVTVDETSMCDYSAGHVSTREAGIFMSMLNERLAPQGARFHAGVSYRNIFVASEEVLGISVDGPVPATTPPHDIMTKPYAEHFPSGQGSEFLIELMKKSRELLKDHEINHVRIDLRENPANMIWLWGAGRKPRIRSFQSRFGVQSAIISAVDLLKGIAVLVGMDVINVPGATGYYDTNYDGKAGYCMDALKTRDLVIVHIEAPDEASHNGDLNQKIQSIQSIDEKIVGPVYEHLKSEYGDDYRIMFLSDHYTSVVKRTHEREPVPVVIAGSGVEHDGVQAYSEEYAVQGGFGLLEGEQLMNAFIKR